MLFCITRYCVFSYIAKSSHSLFSEPPFPHSLTSTNSHFLSLPPRFSARHHTGLHTRRRRRHDATMSWRQRLVIVTGKFRLVCCPDTYDDRHHSHYATCSLYLYLVPYTAPRRHTYEPCRTGGCGGDDKQTTTGLATPPHPRNYSSHFIYYTT